MRSKFHEGRKFHTPYTANNLCTGDVVRDRLTLSLAEANAAASEEWAAKNNCRMLAVEAIYTIALPQYSSNPWQYSSIAVQQYSVTAVSYSSSTHTLAAAIQPYSTRYAVRGWFSGFSAQYVTVRIHKQTIAPHENICVCGACAFEYFLYLCTNSNRFEQQTNSIQHE